MKKKIFLTTMLIALVALACVGALTVYKLYDMRDILLQTSGETGRQTAEVSEQAMREQTSKFLMENAQGQADRADAKFKELSLAVEGIADAASDIYTHPERYGDGTVQRVDRSMIGRVNVHESYASDADREDEALREELQKLANLQGILYSMHERYPQTISSYVAAESGVMLYAEETADNFFNEAGELVPFDAKERAWYTGAKEAGGLFFTDVMADYSSGVYGIACAAPFYRDGDFKGVTGTGMYLSTLQDIVMETNVGATGSSCIVNDHGQIVFSSRESGDLRMGEDAVADLREGENAELAELIKTATDGAEGIAELTLDGEDCYVAYANMETVGWVFLSILPVEEVIAPTRQLSETLQAGTEAELLRINESVRSTLAFIGGIVLATLLLSFLLSQSLSEHLVRPIKRLTEKVRDVEGDKLDFVWTEDTHDETQTLARAFGSMTERMKKYIEDITYITAEKERIGAELNVATQIQADMLPRIFPPFPERTEFDLYASMDPAKEVGGDFYDFFLIDEDHLAMVMADVSGKGVPAALFMVIAKTMLKNRAQMSAAKRVQDAAGETAQGKDDGIDSPAKILADVNNSLCEGNEAELFVTVWLGILTISTGRLVTANAGHEYPALCHADGEFALMKSRHGAPLATMEGLRYREEETFLQSGDKFYIYTDGVTEATNGAQELFGEERLIASLNRLKDRAPQEILTGVREDIDRFVADAPQFDDLTMLCIEFK